MEALQDTLRRQCSFHDIGLWLVENTPISAVEFTSIKRIESIPVSDQGEIMDAWYARDSKDLRCGWTADLRWAVSPNAIWSARNFIEALDMFTLAPLTIRDRHKGSVMVHQKATLLAEKFPSMWLAQKLAGKVD